MKRLMILLVAVLLLPPAVQAREPHPGKRGQPPREHVDSPRQRGERTARPERPRREGHRLTQEERRQLNRDLDRAYRELYRR